MIHKVIPHALGSTLQKLWCKADKDLQEGKRARFTWSRTVMTTVFIRLTALGAY